MILKNLPSPLKLAALGLLATACGACGACRSAEPDSHEQQGVQRAATTDTSALVHFAVLDPGSRDPSGDAFAGRYVRREQRFMQDSVMVSESTPFPLPVPSYVAAFPVRQGLSGVAADGKPVRVMVDSLVRGTGDLYEGQMAAHVVGSPAAFPVLFWTPGVDVTVLRHSPVAIDSVTADRLRAAAESLFVAAFRDGDPDVASGARIMPGAPTAEHVDGMDSLIVVGFRPVLHADSGTVADSLASIFVLYAPARRAVVFGRFGHPEWSAQAKNVVAILPRLYFRIGADPRIYFFGWYSGPWEDNGFGIADLASGRLLLGT